MDAEHFRLSAERAHQMMSGSEMSAFWYRAPIANLFYGLLDGGRPPSQENLKEVLNGYALVTALILTVVMSMPMSMTFEEVELARLRFDGVVRFEFTDEIDYDRRYDDWATGRDMVTAFVRWTVAAVMFLAISLFMVFMVLGLTDLVFKELHYMPTVNRAWWRWMRFVLVAIITSTMLGAMASMYAFSYLIYLKFPDYYVEAHGRPNTWSPYGFGNWFGYVAVLPLFIVVCLLSAATRAAFDAMQGDVDGDGKVDERDKALAASGYDDATAKVAPEK